MDNRSFPLDLTTPADARVVSLVSLGCAKNLVDGECMAGILADDGYRLSLDPAEADVIIVHTCAFIDAAKEEAIDAILTHADWKVEGRCSCLVVTGCLAQRYADEIAAELPEVDIVLGTTAFTRIAEQIEAFYRRRAADGESTGPLIDACYRRDGALAHLEGPRLVSTGVSAYLKIAEGCSNHCTFCAIPGIRGPYLSRDFDAIVAEAERLVAGGVRELILVAQDTTAYGLERDGVRRLPELLRRLDALDIEWLRFLYAYPNGVSDELLDVMAEGRHILPYLDLPIQHASDPVLRRMGRREDVATLRERFARCRARLDDPVLRSTVMLGFPGETEADVDALVDFIEAVEFDHLGAFVFSPEEGTPAARLPADQHIDPETARARYERVMLAQQRVAMRCRAASVGRTEQVLIEGTTADGMFYRGRSWREAPDTDGQVVIASEVPLDTGSFYSCTIIEASPYERMGVIRDESTE